MEGTGNWGSGDVGVLPSIYVVWGLLPSPLPWSHFLLPMKGEKQASLFVVSCSSNMLTHADRDTVLEDKEAGLF